MEDKDILTIFNKMKKTIEDVKPYHEKKMKLRNGDYETPGLDISLPLEYDEKLLTRLDWARIAMAAIMSMLRFDAVKYDTDGYTALLDRCGMYPAIESAIENALGGSIAFIGVLPRDEEDEYPIGVVYTGAEATCIFDSRSDSIEVGLAIHKRDEDGKPTEYLLFEKGFITRLDKDGKILHSAAMPVNEVMMVEFVNARDLANSPHGRSIFTSGAVSALDSGQRTKKLAEIAEDLRIGGGVFIVSDGTPDENKMLTKSGQAGRITTMFTDGGKNTVDFHTLNLPSAEKLQEQMAGHAGDFAAAMFMSPTALGYQPSNGSYSEGTLIEQNKPHEYIRDSMRANFANSIKKLALLLMALATGNEISEEQKNIQPVFCNTKNVSAIAGLGDGLFKIQELGVDLPLDDFVREALGIELKPLMMQVAMPNFAAAKELQALSKELKGDLIEADGKINSRLSFSTPSDIQKAG